MSSWSRGPLVEVLRGPSGIDTISAATCQRPNVESHSQLVFYLPLVLPRTPAKDTRWDGITRAGNREAKCMLIETAPSYQYPACIVKEKLEILIRLPKNLRDMA